MATLLKRLAELESKGGGEFSFLFIRRVIVRPDGTKVPSHGRASVKYAGAIYLQEDGETEEQFERRVEHAALHDPNRRTNAVVVKLDHIDERL